MRPALAASFWLFARAVCAAGQTREERWQADLDALRDRILSTHPNPYTRVTPEAFAQRVETVRERLPRLTDAQAAVELAGIVAMLNDGHSALNLTQTGAGVRRYPLALRWFSDGLFVLGAPESSARLIGARVTSLGGRPVREAYEDVRPWLSYDTEEWALHQSETALGMHEVLVAAGLAELNGPLAIEVERTDGTPAAAQITLDATPFTAGPVSARPGPPLRRTAAGVDLWITTGTWATFGNSGLGRVGAGGQDYWFDWLEAERVLYIRYSRCRESALLPVRAFAAEMIEFLATHPAARWVIDLRDNPGGNEAIFQILINTLQAAVQDRRIAPPERGMYGLINKATFSSGVLAARLLQARGGVLVGEPTGGRASWFGNAPAWPLPHSRLAVGISTTVVGDPATGPALTPSAEALFTGADYFAFQDPYLERALAAP